MYYRRLDGMAAADGGESPHVPPANWDSHLPKPPDDFLSGNRFAVSFRLELGESEYLIHRIAHRAPSSLLTHMLLHRQTVADEQRFPWEASFQPALAPEVAGQLLHARNFSEIMHSAALLYNLILAEQHPGRKFVEPYQQELAMWWDRLQARRDELRSSDRAAFWKLLQDRRTRVRFQTRGFVDAWVSLVLSADAPSATTGATARRLVTEQERCVKPGRARIGNPRATENWQGSSGSAQLDYRWRRPVRAVVNDILEPLMVKEGHPHA